MIKDFHDGMNLLRKFGPRKAWNAGKILFSYLYSKWTGKLWHAGMPIAVSFEPTTYCNLRCPECPSGLRSFTRKTGFLEVDFFKQSIDQLKSTLAYLTFYFQGEPYLHPKFLEMVKYASKSGIYTATSTNAHYLDDKNAKLTVESGLDRLIISIDGTSQETYEQYRIGGKLEKVLQGTRNIVKWKKELKSKKPYILFQFLVVKPNEHQIDEVYKLAKELGVNGVGLKTAQIYDYEQGSPLIPTIDKYARYKKKSDGGYEIKNKMANSCWKMWHSCVITWDGKIVPCCFDKDATYQLGDLANNSFVKNWRSEEYNQFRKTLLRSRSQIEMCKNCTEGTKVWG